MLSVTLLFYGAVQRGGSSSLSIKICGELKGELVRMPRTYSHLEEVQHSLKRATLSEITVMVGKLDMASVVSLTL